MNLVTNNTPTSQGGGTFAGLATQFANIFIIVAFGFSMVSLVFSLFHIIIASGDPKAYEQYMSGVKFGVLGMVISLAAWLIKGIFYGLLGINLSN